MNVFNFQSSFIFTVITKGHNLNPGNYNYFEINGAKSNIWKKRSYTHNDSRKTG